MTNLHTIVFQDKHGSEKNLADYPAKAQLIVNVASKCGLTPQYTGLQALYEKYQAQGLEILAFPANEFLAQEPGSNEEIQNFCSVNYGVTFPVMQKIVVKGEGIHPLYQALTTSHPEATQNADKAFEDRLKGAGLLTGEPHDIHWNFEKFLLNGNGEIVARFFPDITAEDARVVAAIEGLL